MVTAAAPRWRAFGASVQGAAHARRGAPNQDAFECWAAGGGEALAVGAVADGHGGARHFRSGRGAAFAVAAAVDVLREHRDTAPEAASDELPRRIVAAWRRRVAADLAVRPLEADELARAAQDESPAAAADVRADPALAYGATLVAAAARARSTLVLQLGDGEVLCVAPDGRTTRPLPEDARLARGRTTSLCQPEAWREFRVARIGSREPQPAMMVLATDGYANAFRSDRDFLRVGADLFALLRGDGSDALAAQLAGFLGEASAHGSGDDVTVAILHRDPLPDAGLSEIWDDPAPAPERATRPVPARPGGARRWALAGAAVALAVAAVWVVHRKDEAARPGVAAGGAAPARPLPDGRRDPLPQIGDPFPAKDKGRRRDPATRAAE
jgi:hypothetical protein